MPEGPEVKRCADLIRSVAEKCTIKSIESLSDRGKFASLDLGDLQFPLNVRKVVSYGKVIYFKLAAGGYLRSTLGMSGWWYPPVDQLSEKEQNLSLYFDRSGENISTKDFITKALKNARFVMNFMNGNKLYYVDQRNFGNFKAITQDELVSQRDKLGVDPLSIDDEELIFLTLLNTRKKNLTLGEYLLDQSELCGIGNIYRAECMYLSGLSPHRLVGSLTRDEITRFAIVCYYVLNNAYNTNSAMRYSVDWLDKNSSLATHAKWSQVLDHFKTSDNRTIPGHLAYSRKLDIFGDQVKSETFKGRTLWWVPSLQH